MKKNEEALDKAKEVVDKTVTIVTERTQPWMVMLLVFIALCGGLLFYRNQAINNEREVAAFKARAEMAKTVEEQEKKLKEMEGREKDLYPKIEEANKKLASLNDQISKKRAQLKKESDPTYIKEQVDKLPDTALVVEFYKKFGIEGTMVKKEQVKE